MRRAPRSCTGGAGDPASGGVNSGQGPDEDATSGLAVDEDAEAGVLRVGLVADPGLPAGITGELADEYREREGWDVVMFLTDLPRRSGTEPVVADVSIRHAAALISLPGIGWIPAPVSTGDRPTSASGG